MESTISKDKNGYTVFFDLDHTIIANVSGKELAVNAVRKGYIGYYVLLRVVIQYLLYKVKAIDPQRMSENMIKWTRGISEIKINELCTDTTGNKLVPFIYAEALKEIELHRKNKARIVMLSASILQICSEISSVVATDEIICTILESRNGVLTGKTIGSICFGDEKIRRLRDYCTIKGIDISESWYYGDSVSDFPVFLAVGVPVCVNPDKKLRKAAVNKGWKILSWSC